MSASQLVFVDRSEHYDDGSANLRWVADNYEIVAYEHTDEITGSEGLLYYAFVAIEPLKADGFPGHVDNRRVYKEPKRTFEDAANACRAHSIS